MNFLVSNYKCFKNFLRCINVNLPDRHDIINNKPKSSLKVQFRCCSEAINEQFKLNENDDVYNKLIYNENLIKMPAKKTTSVRPAFLKYLMKDNSRVHENKIKEEPEFVKFPFRVREQFVPGIYTMDETTEGNASDKGEWKFHKYKIDKNNLEDPRRWNFLSLTDDKIGDVIKFGTCDPSMPVTKIPCGGCGALFHCNDPSIPGFIPKEIFKINKQTELGAQICQRCHFLRTFNVALGVNVSSSQYEQIISTIKNKVSLVIFMIDLLDFPCSIYPEVFNLIGPEKPVVVVANKIDLLMQEDPSFLNNFKESLLFSLREKNFNVENIKHVALISAKTGYGIEELISVLQNCWGNEGDVYLIGCTNVGKSSLFNIFLQSDYCKINAADILQRATVSTWPGTTLNLLKFPISKALSWRLAARQNRLLKENEQKLALQRLQYSQQNLRLQQIPLADYVGRTFREAENTKYSHQPNQPPYQEINKHKTGINPRSPEFAFSKWFYDTPGVVHPDQILNLLTTDELLLTVPSKILIPRNFQLQPGHSLFIGGIARLDYISGPKFVWFTVFASDKLPISVTKLQDAAFVYKKLLGSPLFRVPTEGKIRLSQWPELASKKIEICGKLQRSRASKSNSNAGKEADADVVLSSAGWVSVCVQPPYRCVVEAWTPEGRGIHVRKVPIIKRGHTFRGERIQNTPAYRSVVKQIRGYSLTDEPPL